MTDALLNGLFLTLSKVIGDGLGAIGGTGLDKILKKTNKNKTQITGEFQRIIEDIRRDTFSKCVTKKIENINNDEFCKRIYDLGLNEDNLTTLIDGVKTQFSKDTKISEKIISVEKLDSEIKKEKSELENLKKDLEELQNKEIKEFEDKIKDLKNKKTKIEEEKKGLQQVITDLENKKTKIEEEKAENKKTLKDVESELQSNKKKINDLESSHKKIVNDINSNKNTKSKDLQKKEDNIKTIEEKIKKLEEEKSKNQNLTISCITSRTDVPVMNYEKIVFFLNTRLDKLKEDYEKYYKEKEEKEKEEEKKRQMIIEDCDKTIDIEEYCNKPENKEYSKKASECYKVYQINKERLNDNSKKKYEDLKNTYELYCKKDQFKKDKLIPEIKKYLENVIKNYKSISNDCKDSKCILSLIKNYENEFRYFNIYLTVKFKGGDVGYEEASKKIKELLTYNISSVDDTDSNITNFFTNNSIKQYDLKSLNYMTVLNTYTMTKDWDTETKQLLDKIKNTKILKEQKEEEKKKEQEQKRVLSEKNKQEESERERKLMEQREKEKRIELERAKEREHERSLEALKGKSSSLSSSTDSTKSSGMGILMFTASAVLLGGVGIAFASK
jgi:predicted  nucleic acid-binding Zn-ribbon protein